MNSLKFISSGAYGSVFDTGKFALKVTVDPGEVENAKIIMNNPHPNVVKIYQVYEEDPSSEQFRRWIILMEKVQTPTHKQNNEIQDFWWNSNFDEIIKIRSRPWWSGFFISDVVNELGDYRIPKFWKGINEGIDHSNSVFVKKYLGKWILQSKKLRTFIQKNKIKCSDLHDQNWGWNKNGNLKVFDISSCDADSPEGDLDMKSEFGKKNLKFAQEFWNNNYHIYTKKRNHGKSN